MCDHQDFLIVVRDAWRIKTKGDGLQNLWYKLKNVKTGLKRMHSKEFSGITTKINTWEKEHDCTQTEMQHNWTNEDLHQKEKEVINQVRKWRKIEDMALRQKSRITWFRSGDDNTAFFHASIKERRATNGIHELIQIASGSTLRKHSKMRSTSSIKSSKVLPLKTLW